MRLAGRTPEDLLGVAGLGIPNRLATYLDASGRTVLHWAIKQWSYDYLEPKVNDLSEFIIALLRSPHLVYSLDTNGMTPLAYMLDYETADTEWVIQHSGFANPATMIEDWGKLLVEVNILLPDYVARENDSLRSVKVKFRDQWHFGNYYMLQSLLLLKGGTLGLEIKKTSVLGVWEFKPPPGALPDVRQDHSSICWEPTVHDGTESFWQRRSRTILGSSPFILTPDFELNPERIAADTRFGFHVDDDHSPLSLLLSYERRLRDQNNLCRSRRSASAPPLARLANPSDKLLWFSFGPALDWQCFVAHQCLLDSRWRFSEFKIGHFGFHNWRGCKSGCEGPKDSAAALHCA